MEQFVNFKDLEDLTDVDNACTHVHVQVQGSFMKVTYFQTSEDVGGWGVHALQSHAVQRDELSTDHRAPQLHRFHDLLRNPLQHGRRRPAHDQQPHARRWRHSGECSSHVPFLSLKSDRMSRPRMPLTAPKSDLFASKAFLVGV